MELPRTAGTPLEYCVTASQLVRNFGLWQDRATRHPVYVMRRGRAHLVLATVDLLEALCTVRPATGGEGDRDLLLDVIDDMVLLLDGERRIVAANVAARAYWRIDRGAAAVPVAAALAEPLGSFVEQAAARVGRQRVVERIELGQAGGEAGRLALTAVPLADGTAIVAHDLYRDEAGDAARAAFGAVEDALSMVDGAARASVNPRGYLADATPSFVRMSGLGAEALRAVRFVSLIEIGTRVAVAEAIEATFSGTGARRVDATLLRNGGAPLPVAIGLSPLVRNLAPRAVEMVLVARQ